MRFLTVEELWRLADSIDGRYKGLVLLGEYGGLRVGQMLGLRWGRVDVASGRIGVVEAMTELAGRISFGPPKTRTAVRTVTVPRFVTTELSALASAIHHADELVFRSPEGQPRSARPFPPPDSDPAVKKTDLAPLRIHDLRHTAVASRRRRERRSSRCWRLRRCMTHRHDRIPEPCVRCGGGNPSRPAVPGQASSARLLADR